MSLKQFLTSRVFSQQLLLVIAVTLGFIILVLMALRMYTHHGEAFPVPDVYGMTEDQFEEAIEDADLKYKVIDSAYNEQLKPGGVIGQIPEAGHKVKRDRTIFLTLNAVSPGTVSFPRVTDISHRQAIVQLESVGLVPGKVTFEPSEFQNLVLKAKLNGREIGEGEMVTVGSTIDLVLGSGQSGNSTVLPDLKGMTLGEARIALANNSLNLGTHFFDESIANPADSLIARVYRQHPQPKFSFHTSAGTEVDVWLTTDDSKLKDESQEKSPH